MCVQRGSSGGASPGGKPRLTAAIFIGGNVQQGACVVMLGQAPCGWGFKFLDGLWSICSDQSSASAGVAFAAGMPTLKKFCSSLRWDFRLSLLPCSPSLLSISLLVFDEVSTKTRFHSHISFLSDCLRLRLTSHGFQLKFHPSCFKSTQDYRGFEGEDLKTGNTNQAADQDPTESHDSSGPEYHPLNVEGEMFVCSFCGKRFQTSV
ncbi:uncharacterized protein [Heterodontus francisci]|uniref:uncharacterized protein n=1 Tax=Heterodontus francisci TaxID=7792 RepID=UPI00355C2B0F